MRHTLRCAIVDDIAADAEWLASAVADLCADRAVDCDCVCLDSPSAFVAACRADRFDAVFLDGYFDTLASPDDARTTGLDAARWLRRHGYDVPVVFTTVSVDFAVAGYGVDALGYLVKPFSRADLAVVLDKIVGRIASAGAAVPTGPSGTAGPSGTDGSVRGGASGMDGRHDMTGRTAGTVAVASPTGVRGVVDLPIGVRDARVLGARMSPAAMATVVVPADDAASPILRVDADRLAYCRADLHRIALYDALDPSAAAFDVRMSLTALEAALAAFPRFFACARGYIVNLDCVSGLEEDAFVLSRGGVRVPVSRRRAAQARSRYADHVFTAMRGGRSALPSVGGAADDSGSRP